MYTFLHIYRGFRLGSSIGYSRHIGQILRIPIALQPFINLIEFLVGQIFAGVILVIIALILLVLLLVLF